MSRPTILATGEAPEQAIHALGRELGWGPLDRFEEQEANASDEWYYRFRADGTSMKAAGDYVPGGVTLTWWK